MTRNYGTYATLIIALLSLIATACGDLDSRWCAYSDPSPKGWAYGDTLTFATGELPDSVMSGTLLLAVSHNNDYPYSNLWLEVTQTDSRGHVRRDTLNCVLSDIYGHWQGRGFGTTYQYIDTVPGTATLTRRGGKITVRHIMRVDTLPDIEHVGLLLVD